MKRSFWHISVIFPAALFLLAAANIYGQRPPVSCGQKKADRLIGEGIAAYNKKDYAQALALLDQAEKAAPKCPETFFQRALVLTDSKNYDGAIAASEAALNRNFNEPFRLYYSICQARFSQEKQQEAINSCEEAARLNDKFFWTFYNLAYLYSNVGATDKSLAATERSLAIDPKSVEMLVHKSQLLFMAQKFQESAAVVSEAIKLAPNNEQAHRILAINYSAMNKTDEAVKAAQRAYELNPKSFEAINLKAAALNDLRKYEEALPLAVEAVRLEPNNERAHFVLGMTHFNLKNYDKAVESLAQSVKLKPDFFESWLLLSSAHVQSSNNWEKGEIAALEAVRLRPDNGDANFQLGLAQMSNGKTELSVKSFDEAIKNKSLRSVSASAFKGLALVALKRQPEAEKAFAQAFTFKPGAHNDYYSLAEIYFYRWELEKARAELRKAIDFAADDEDDSAYSYLSWSYILGGNPQEAIAAANEAVQQNPKYPSSYINRCRAFNEANLPDIAIKDCQKALSLRPESGETFYYLGRSYALKKDAAQEKAYNLKAIDAIEKRLKFSFRTLKPVTISNVADKPAPQKDEGAVTVNSPNYSYMLYLLASAYFIDNNFEAAAKAYEKALETRPRFPNLRYNLAVAYLRLKRPDVARAETQYKELAKLDPKLAANLRKFIGGYKARKAR